ncbi:uroporphyrinogen-III synthase [Hyphomonas sp. WL0036]|uniref:uroporphyrinogen-III synthase n=1 Tax=Hyphomonas sediminis TaxID=2866160 RepID=UPI001C817313|nr:uroporphyrinogen-III synthase [Hyphomonas sediminis]
MTPIPGRAVIVTRTQPGADETAARLKALGFAPIVSPMLRIVQTGLAPTLLDGVADIVFTSANGVRAFALAGASPAELTAWCVGPSTAEAARQVGFGRVVEGDGDAEDLARLIVTARSELLGPLLHIANDAAAGNLVAGLKTAGLDARFAAPYNTEAAPALTEEALAALHAPVFLLIHSAKGAAAIAASGADLCCAVLIAISETAAAPLTDIPKAGLHIAGRPNEDALMEALSAAAGA